MACDACAIERQIVLEHETAHMSDAQFEVFVKRIYDPAVCMVCGTSVGVQDGFCYPCIVATAD